MYIILGFVAIIVLFALIGAFFSVKLRTRQLEITGGNSSVMQGYKIVLLADLHGRFIGKNQDKLTDAILKQKPDLVIMAGDMVDAYDTDAKAAAVLAARLSGKVNIIAVRGNHFYKADAKTRKEMEKAFNAAGITSLKNQKKSFWYKDSKISIDGYDDPIAVTGYVGVRKREQLRRNKVVMHDAMETMLGENQHADYTIVLCHRPTNADMFAAEGYDLMLAGHTHGGQMALPFGLEPVGNEVIPFPKKNMQSGLHYHNKMPLVITSGIGYSNIHLRTFMPPEIAVITFV